ncbi:MAG TPA: hypothetical protein VH817_14710 [Thermoleophilaceae bacterium]
MLVAAALLLTASSAHASATITYPPNGATVQLDKKANFSFSWTMAPGEIMPSPYVGDSPTYDPDTFAPFNSGCGVLADTATSCKPDEPISAGTHYVFIDTVNNDVTQHFESPVTSFRVPPFLALGCGPVAQSCSATNKGFRILYVPHPPIGLPNSTIEMGAWANAPDDTAVHYAFTLKRGHKVIARLKDVQDSGELLTQSGFELTHAQILWGHHRKHWHAPKGGTRLSVVCTVSVQGVTLTRTKTMRTPPR